MKASPLLLALALLWPSARPAGAQEAAAKPDILVPEVLHGFTAGIGNFDSGAIGYSDNNFYGVTQAGGKYGKGTFFRVIPGSTPTVDILAEFGEPDNGGARGIGPLGPLVSNGAGKFYGVTTTGGRFGFGTVFRVSLDGTIETLVDFSGAEGAAPGAFPRAGLTVGADGFYYGTTSGDSHTRQKGHVFRVSAAGTYEPLLQFTGQAGAFPGDFPRAPLLRLLDNSFVGTTESGGSANQGVIFRLDASGRNYRQIASFSGSDSATTVAGRFPFGSLIQKSDGAVYGLVRGNLGDTNIWQLPLDATTASTHRVVDQDSGGNFLSNPCGGLAQLEDGDFLIAFSFDSNLQDGGLYSVDEDTGVVTKLAGFTASPISTFNAYALNPDGNGGYLGTQEGQLYSYRNGTFQYLGEIDADGDTSTGASPDGPVALAPDGTLYGHCAVGGFYQAGTIYQYPAGGTLDLLTPLDPAIVGGTLRRVTLTPKPTGELLFIGPSGGAIRRGAIFKADTSGIVSEVASFTGTAPNNFARSPEGALTPDGLGNYYGEAAPAAFDSNDPVVVFKLGVDESLTAVATVPRFGIPENNFLSPGGALTLDASGTNLLGVVQNLGGVSKKGFLYRVALGGTASQVVNLDSGANRIGAGRPQAPLVPEPSSGGFIFSTIGSSDQNGFEQLVRLTSTNTLERLYRFDTSNFETAPAGSFQRAPAVVQPSTGKIFGVAEYGGVFGGGILFRRTPDGNFSVLHQFRPGTASPASGLTPESGLTLGPDGMIYGTTSVGGPFGGGTVFRFAPTPNPAAGNAVSVDVQANAAVVAGDLTNNGYAGEYWFRFGTEPGNLDQESAHVSFAGFHGTLSLSALLAGLKGHTTYYFELHASVGPGSEAVVVTGTSSTFTTPNGAPIAQDDNILGDTLAGPFFGEVKLNDFDPDGEEVQILSAENGTHGNVAILGDTLVYTPGLTFSGTDTFTYTITDNQTPPLTAEATVTVRTAEAAVGEYAGLLVEAPPGTTLAPQVAPRDIGPIDRLIAGLAQMSISRNRNFSARFMIGNRMVPVKGRLAVDRDTTLRGDGGRFGGLLRVGPAATQAVITYNGRTLVLRAGQAFAFVPGAPPPPKSDFTMRFTPETEANPVNTPGVPAGTGTGIIRQGTKGRATIVGTLPDGTKFSRSSVIDQEGHFPYQASIYKGKTGSFDGELVIATSGNVDAAENTTIRWIKAAQPKEKRFPGGFSTRLAVFGGKYTVPGKGTPPLGDANGTLQSSFARGGLFLPTSSRFTLRGAKAVVDPGANEARATLNLNARTGLISGSFRAAGAKKNTKFTGIVVQRDQQGSGYFLGPADAGSVQVSVVE